MVVNKGKIIVMTVVATLLYILFEYAVGEHPFGGPLFADDYLFSEDGSWLRWVCLIAIPVLGLWQAMQLGDREIEVEEYERSNAVSGQVSDPAWWRALSGNTWWSVLWLPLRFVLGVHWLEAGWHKTQEAGWALSGTGMVRQPDGTMAEGFLNRGDSMRGFLMGAYTPNPETGVTKAVFGWYANVLEFIVDQGWTSWLGPVIAWGEVLVGVGLLLGGLVGIAAFFGTVMNMSFMLAGTVSANPWMFGMTVFIILGWKVAGHLGLDRWFLSFLKTPWDRDGGESAVATTPQVATTPYSTTPVAGSRTTDSTTVVRTEDTNRTQM